MWQAPYEITHISRVTMLIVESAFTLSASMDILSLVLNPANALENSLPMLESILKESLIASLGRVESAPAMHLALFVELALIFVRFFVLVPSDIPL